MNAHLRPRPDTLPAGVTALSVNRYQTARDELPVALGPDSDATHDDGVLTVIASPTRFRTGCYLFLYLDGATFCALAPGRDAPPVHPADLGSFWARHGMAGLTALTAALEHPAENPPLADVLAAVEEALTP